MTIIGSLTARLDALKRHRVARDSAANLLGIGVKIGYQILSVPILLTALGEYRFGIWLLLFTIPSYLALSDLGLTTAAQNDMAAAHARGDIPEVRTVYHSMFAMIGGIAGALLLAITAIVLIDPGGMVARLDEIADERWTIIALALYATAAMVSMAPLAALQSTGLYVLGALLFDGFALIESVVLLAVALMTGSLALMAIAYAAIRCIATITLLDAVRRYRPELGIPPGHARLETLRALMPAALALFAVPVALATGLQGTALIVGAVLGPIAVATFVPVRTAARLSLQLVGVISRAMMPSLAAAGGRGASESEERLWRLNDRVIGIVLLPMILAFALFGTLIVKLWSGDVIEPSHALVAIIAASVLAHALWYYGVTMLSTTRDHITMAAPILLVTVFGLAASWVLARTWGLEGAAVGVLLGDVLLALLARRQITRRRAYLRADRVSTEMSHGA